MNGSRYLPDRRDLNRSFPGSAARLAGGPDRPPDDDRGGRQVRGRHRPAHRLGPPHQPAADPRRPRRPAHPRAGRRLRRAGDAARASCATARCATAARERGAKVLLYEAGEAWRMDQWAIDAGVRGVRRVLAALGMIDPLAEETPAPSVGVAAQRLGPRPRHRHPPPRGRARAAVETGERLGGLFDSFGKRVAAGPRRPARHRGRADRGARWSTAATRWCTSPRSSAT